MECLCVIEGACYKSSFINKTVFCENMWILYSMLHEIYQNHSSIFNYYSRTILYKMFTNLTYLACDLNWFVTKSYISSPGFRQHLYLFHFYKRFVPSLSKDSCKWPLVPSGVYFNHKILLLQYKHATNIRSILNNFYYDYYSKGSQLTMWS